MKKHIPNIITCCNLLSGAIAVMLAAEGLFHCALGMIILGAVFDFFDGMSARARKSTRWRMSSPSVWLLP